MPDLPDVVEERAELNLLDLLGAEAVGARGRYREARHALRVATRVRVLLVDRLRQHLDGRKEELLVLGRRRLELLELVLDFIAHVVEALREQPSSFRLFSWMGWRSPRARALRALGQRRMGSTSRFAKSVPKRSASITEPMLHSSVVFFIARRRRTPSPPRARAARPSPSRARWRTRRASPGHRRSRGKRRAWSASPRLAEGGDEVRLEHLLLRLVPARLRQQALPVRIHQVDDVELLAPRLEPALELPQADDRGDDGDHVVTPLDGLHHQEERRWPWGTATIASPFRPRRGACGRAPPRRWRRASGPPAGRLDELDLPRELGRSFRRDCEDELQQVGIDFEIAVERGAIADGRHRREGAAGRDGGLEPSCETLDRALLGADELAQLARDRLGDDELVLLLLGFEPVAVERGEPQAEQSAGWHRRGRGASRPR